MRFRACVHLDPEIVTGEARHQEPADGRQPHARRLGTGQEDARELLGIRLQQRSGVVVDEQGSVDQRQTLATVCSPDLDDLRAARAVFEGQASRSDQARGGARHRRFDAEGEDIVRAGRER